MRVVMKAAVFVVKHKRQIGIIIGSVLTICGYDFGDEVVRYSTTWS